MSDHYDVNCARCGTRVSTEWAFIEEGDEWECPRCWHRCEEKELRDEIKRLAAELAEAKATLSVNRGITASLETQIGQVRVSRDVADAKTAGMKRQRDHVVAERDALRAALLHLKPNREETSYDWQDRAIREINEALRGTERNVHEVCIRGYIGP
jgi:DNA-directed RNA polymerase subunit RPC12/RpoP